MFSMGKISLIYGLIYQNFLECPFVCHVSRQDGSNYQIIHTHSSVKHVRVSGS